MSMKSRLYMMALGMAALMGNDSLSHRVGASDFPDTPKIVPHHSGSFEHYTFEDGFECDAYSPEQAEKKHRKWWKEIGRFKKS